VFERNRHPGIVWFLGYKRLDGRLERPRVLDDALRGVGGTHARVSEDHVVAVALSQNIDLMNPWLVANGRSAVSRRRCARDLDSQIPVVSEATTLALAFLLR
jgi:hypothetical protein